MVDKSWHNQIQDSKDFQKRISMIVLGISSGILIGEAVLRGIRYLANKSLVKPTQYIISLIESGKVRKIEIERELAILQEIKINLDKLQNAIDHNNYRLSLNLIINTNYLISSIHYIDVRTARVELLTLRKRFSLALKS